MINFHMFSGTTSAYAGMMKLQMKWNSKQEQKSYTQKAEQEDPVLRQLNDLKEQNQKSSGKEAILNKLRAGKKLTQDEMDYLQREDPAAYQKAKEIQDAKAGYERSLKNCKTKEDVQRLKSLHLGSTMVKVGAIANDPNIPEGKKMELLLHENAKLNAINKAERAFVQSNAYHSLPTDAEVKEAMKQEMEKLEESVQTPQEGEAPAAPELSEVADDKKPVDKLEETDITAFVAAAAVAGSATEVKPEEGAAPRSQEDPIADIHPEEVHYEAYSRGKASYQTVAAQKTAEYKTQKISKKA